MRWIGIGAPTLGLLTFVVSQLPLGEWGKAIKGAESGDAGGRRGSGAELEDFFSGLEVHRFDIAIKPHLMAELERKPRHYVEADLAYKGEKYGDIKLRLKGNRSFQGWEGKPAFKLKLSEKRHPKGFFGMYELTLNNMVEDPTLLRETLAYEVYRDAGIPAPRTAYADVFVNGRSYGLHLFLEPVDEVLLGEFLESGDGLLYEGEYSCDFYRSDVDGLQEQLGSDPKRLELRKFTEKLDAKAGQPFLERARPLLDEERTVTFLALNQLMGDFDGYGHGHNYFAYFEPRNQKWLLLPWGQDRIFYRHLSLLESDGRLARDCFEDAACRLKYVQAVHRVAHRVKELDLDVAAKRQERLIAKSVKNDPRLPVSAKERQKAVLELHEFLRVRPAEMLDMASCWDGHQELDHDGDGHSCMDCDDNDPSVHPGAKELCNKRDDNCSGLIDDNPACECEPVELEGAVFSLCDLKMDYDSAERFCESRGEKIARVDSSDEARALYKASQAIREGDWWIGLTDRVEEGEYRWTDTGKSGYQTWASSEPDGYACGQNCASINRNRWANFRDLHCMERVPFICRAEGGRPSAPDEGRPSNSEEEGGSRERDVQGSGSSD